jgi:hypothetical protein
MAETSTAAATVFAFRVTRDGPAAAARSSTNS